MADSLFDACGNAGKCNCVFFTNLDPKSPGITADGLVRHWSVNYDVQVRLMGTVQDTGSATVGDLIAVLPGHPAPTAAIMALVDEGFLVREPSALTPHTRINLPDADEATIGSEETPLTPAPTGQSGGKVIAFPATVAHLDSTRFVPSVSVVDLKNCGDLPRFEDPAIYLGVKGYLLYPGLTGDASTRISAPHLRGYDKVAVFRDQSGQMTQVQATAAERILGLIAQSLPDYRLDPQLPHGAAVSREDYVALRLFVAEGLMLAQRLGLGLKNIPTRTLLGGPVGASERMLPGGAKAIPQGNEYHLYACGVEARAVEHEGDWIILPGSEIRKKVTRTAGSVIANLREEWLFSGVLKDEGPRYRLAVPVVFDSGSGAANFVLGSKGPNLSAWSGAGSSALERMPLNP